MEQTEKRMAGDYEIIYALHIGAREVVVGVNPAHEYLCGYCTENEIFSSYTDNVLSDDYLAIMEVFTQRVQGQIEAAKAERKTVRIPLSLITAEQCFPPEATGSFVDKVVAIKPDSLRYEYQRADRQLLLVTGGNGARRDARGSAVFGINLFTGHKAGRWERWDIMGEVKPEHIPDWAKERLNVIRREQRLEKERGDER